MIYIEFLNTSARDLRCPRRWYCDGIATGDLGESWRILDIGKMIATTAPGISVGPKSPDSRGPVSMKRFNRFTHVTDSKHRLQFAMKYLLRGKATIRTNRRAHWALITFA